MDCVTEQDQVDLQMAADMVEEGKRLRRRVLARIRQRTFRKRELERRDKKL